MGTVYLAQHHVLDARVAIKVIRRDAERTEEDVSRFFTEARSASRIGHENIVGVLDFGRTADGDPYYIMELLTGMSLAARLAQPERPLAEVLHIATQIADALTASHAKGIVHRDLKPGNVFLVRRGADARFVKLLDFGVAKLTEDEGEEQRGHRTNTGRLLGTPHYMAPEQVAGRRTIDGRADVYALGVLLFEMICGRLPFEAAKWTEVLIQHVTQPPPRARERAAECPAWLDRLIDRALAKTPQERPSMASMRDALRAQDDAIVEPARPPQVTADWPPPSLPTSPADAPTLSSETQVASAETLPSNDPRVADEARAKLATRRRKRTAVLVAAALGMGGTALGAVVVGLGARDDRAAATEVLDGGTGAARPTVRGFGPLIDKAKTARWQLEDAGVAASAAAAQPGPGPAVVAAPQRALRRPDVPVPIVLPDHLDGFDVDHALAPTRPAVADCNTRYPQLSSLDVTIVVGGNGQVLDVLLDSEFVGTPFSMCVARVIVATANFPPFSGAAQDVPYTYGFAPPTL